MTTVIWKYVLELDEVQTVKMPAGAKILGVFVQNNQPILYAMVDIRYEREAVEIYTFVTGQFAPLESFHYIGTYLVNEETFVGHVFTKA